MYRALIVEDEDLMRDYLAANLTNFCPEWETADIACDGAEALEKLQKENFDGVLTDIRMPVMDGLEMARILREQKKNIPILILSGYDEFDYARTAVRLNISDYLLKPIDEEELSAALSLMAIQAASNQREQGISISMQASAKNGLVQKAQEYILTHYADPISLTSVAEELGVTAAYLSTVFHREMGSSYSQTLLRIRMENAAALLSDTQQGSGDRAGCWLSFCQTFHLRIRAVLSLFSGRVPNQESEYAIVVRGAARPYCATATANNCCRRKPVEKDVLAIGAANIAVLICEEICCGTRARDSAATIPTVCLTNLRKIDKL